MLTKIHVVEDVEILNTLDGDAFFKKTYQVFKLLFKSR